MSKQRNIDEIQNLKRKERNYAIALVIIISVTVLTGLKASFEYESFLPVVIITIAACVFVVGPLVYTWEKCTKERVRLEVNVKLVICLRCGQRHCRATNIIPGVGS